MHRVEKMKDQLIDIAVQQLAKGTDKVNTQEMGLVVDMIKDLCCAERECAETEYYEAVTEAMGEPGRYGYPGGRGGRTGRRGYEGMMPEDPDDRMGYANQYGRNWPANPSNRRRNRRRGYSDDSMDNLRSMMDEADPERRRQLMRDIEDMMREM